MKIKGTAISAREVVLINLVFAAGVISIIDESYRKNFFQLAETGLVGYFAMSVPNLGTTKDKKEEE